MVCNINVYSCYYSIFHFYGTLVLKVKKRDSTEIKNKKLDKGLLDFKRLKDTADYIIASEKNQSKTVVLALDMVNVLELGKLLGEDMEDVLVKETVIRVKSCIRSTDFISINQETMYILLSRVSSYKDIKMIVERITHKFQTQFALKGRGYSLSTSIGVAVHPEDGIDVTLLMKNAETVMFQARASGKNNYYFYEDTLNDKAKKHDELARDLKLAIQEEQFHLVYQPQVDMITSKIVGVEALIRWNHPTKGLISPLDFIPTAESTGLIIPLGDWIMKEAFKQYKEWGKDGLKLSINLSGYQFRQDDLLDTLKSVVDELSMNPSDIVLEITESTSMFDIHHTEQVLHGLRQMGFGLAIDDFGTGYSSLAYLRNFPITCLKIDRTFVNDMVSNEEGLFVIQSIISLAKSLRLLIIAEGVETQEQVDVLVSLGVEEAQGYLYSAPVSGEGIRKLVSGESIIC